ncbi:MAG: HD domain-containing protein [Ruminococcaceae bacterium]|nr:HD domain-containing protein [Oscillospiraceae bacterium]
MKRRKGSVNSSAYVGFIPAVRQTAVLLAVVMLITSTVFGLGFGSSAIEEIDTTGKGIGFSSVLYDSTNGLPTSEANAVVQSSDGLIWIGGYSGLIRYDGNEFYRYPPSTGIANVACLFTDSSNRLWVGTNDSGVAVMENNKFTFYGKAQGLASSSVRSVTEDTKGNIIVATTQGLAYIDPDSLELHIIDEPQVNKEYICELKRAADGKIYGVTLAGGFFVLENKKITAFYSSANLGHDTVNTVYPDPENPDTLYIGTQGGEVIVCNLGNQIKILKTYIIEEQNTVNDIKIIDGQIWLCTDNGIGFIYNDVFIPILDVPMTNSVDKMMIDYEENLWFCSSRQGVLKVSLNSFSDIFKLANLDPRVVNATCKYNDELYIGTDTGIIVLDSNYQVKNKRITELLDGNRIRCIRKDSSDRLWICTYSEHGLLCYNPARDSWTGFDDTNGLASNRVRMVTELSDGSIAAATNAGLNLIKDGKVIATYDADEGITNLEILCIEEGPDGSIYLGSDGDGIYIVKDGSVSRIGLDDGLASEVILRIKKSPDASAYWIVTSNSIAFLKDGKVTTVHNFPYSNNYDIYFDNDGCMWILSSNGVYVVKQDEMFKNENIDYTLYDISSGLSNVPTVNSYSCLADDGTLYMACSSGVNSINIIHGAEENTNLKLSIPFIMADDTYISTGNLKEIHIPSNCKRLNIYANAYTYALKNPHLSYCLEGFDDKPFKTTRHDMSYASYTNLRGGTYTFRLSLLDSTTGEIKQSTELKIIKDKAIYEKTWFILLVCLFFLMLVAGIVALYFRKKTAKLIKKQEENRKLINEMTSAFAKCIDMKDAYTNGHSFRVAKYTALLARKLGKSKEEVERIYNIALLHDIGKISIPDSILNKPGKLDDEEYGIMKSHSERGNNILKDITIAPDLALGAGYHHERMDGRGYPSGLSGEDIPEVAQIIAVADTFDAMYSTRPYRKKMKLDDVAREINRCSGTQLSEKVVKVFMELYEEGAFDDEE